MQVDQYTIHDSHTHPVETMTLADIVAESSNIGMAKVGTLVGKTTLASYLNRFGFGRTTGLGFPGESQGIVPALSDWSDASLATISYGQGVSVTPLQMASVYATVANGGVWVRPRLVSGTVDGSGTFSPAPASPTKRVLQPQTASILAQMLAYVVEGGTGTSAQIPGYQVAGKTGTALKPAPTGGYYSDRYVASFIGFLPAGDPRIVVAAILDEPATIYGGVAAAPLFQQVARYAIQRLGIPTAPPSRFRHTCSGSHDPERPANGGAGKLGGGDIRLPPVAFVDLVAAVPGATIRGDGEVAVTDVAFDSREVTPGALFFCVPGLHVDGHAFASQALNAGAAALVVERWLDVEAPQALVPSVRRAMGPMSAVAFGHPASSMATVGVTGTNGKTTVTYLLASIFDAAGWTAGVVGTTGASVAGEPVPLARTTPEAPDLHRLLARMRDRGVRGAALEVSSHALEQHRVDGRRVRRRGLHEPVAGPSGLPRHDGCVLRRQGAAVHAGARPLGSRERRRPVRAPAVARRRDPHDDVRDRSGRRSSCPRCRRHP